MEIIKLPAGEEAPKDSDCINIERAPDGTHVLNASALMSCGDGEEAESVSMIGGKPYHSYEDAEAAGLAWAAEYCVAEVYITCKG